MDEGSSFKAPARYGGEGTHKNATFRFQITNNPYVLSGIQGLFVCVEVAYIDCLLES